MSVFTMEESAATASDRIRVERRGPRRVPKIVPDRRRYRRMPVELHGRFMAPDKQEYPCEVFNMSAGGMALRAPISCQRRERIVAYLENLGRLEGTVVRCFEGGFAVEFKASAQKRERIVNLLAWHANRDMLGEKERRHERFEPRITEQKLILPSGDVLECRVIDVSLSGASVGTNLKPPIDSVVVLGRLRGRVVRHHDHGIGIQFAELQDPDSLARTFD